MAEGAHGDRVQALAKISKLLGGGARDSAAARRAEAERKQAAVSGQSRGAADEREALEALLPLLLGAGGESGSVEALAGRLVAGVEAIRARLGVLDEEAAQRRRRLMKLQAQAAESDSSSSEEDDGAAMTAVAQTAAAAMSKAAAAAAAATPGQRREEWLKRSLLAFVRSTLAAGPADDVPAALAPGGALLDPGHWIGLAPPGSGMTIGVAGSPPGGARALDEDGARSSLAMRGFLLAPTAWPAAVAESLDALPDGVPRRPVAPLPHPHATCHPTLTVLGAW
jgi:hypothetical protein